MKVLFKQDLIEFLEYPFSPSSVCSQRIVSVSEIKYVDFGFVPPVINTRGEFVFIPHEYRKKLELFALNNRISHSNNVDIWGLILEPFEDSADFDKESNAKRFMAYGLSADKVKKFRQRYRMWQIFNIFKGDLGIGWRPDIGMFDALCEASVLELLPFRGSKLFKKIYWEVMNVAKKAQSNTDTHHL